MADEQDLLLPIANVGRIMKQIPPPSAKISKEAKETMQECVSEFIKFVTGEASEKCQRENRKTVNGDDICWALSALGFDDHAEAIVRYLHKYREFERERLNQRVQNEVDSTRTISGASDYKCIQAGKQTETSTPLLLFEVTDQNGNSSLTKPF
ncbi:hypothetical protein AAG906_004121 [Vitis piasezkii]|uniref:Nuclear transcription factor Y subunit B-5 n=1 Tax=Vitis vinifera TaxID=29760 RepID=A0A438JRA2_VITVI|nr:nuclear transcription factor Y subunit B-4-like [Vitis riparia]RVX11473.1 Nuclear transcription factor Y subunit B-5 [Vitis vinifera]